jgi:hypothetical protein
MWKKYFLSIGRFGNSMVRNSKQADLAKAIMKFEEFYHRIRADLL